MMISMVSPHNFIDTEVPPKVTNAESQARYRVKNPTAKRDYRHENSKWQTDAHYLARGFVAWDGEGITDPDGSHRYVMLAVKSDTDSDYLGSVTGLGTAQIFDFVLATAERESMGIHVIYGGGYDFNMWMRDINKETLSRVYKDKYATWNGYRIGWRPGKSFYLCRVNGGGHKVGVGVTIYDCVSFFQCPFVKACDDYLGNGFYERELIVSNKALRQTFTTDDIPEVRRYNDAELTNLLKLMQELRARLNKVGLRPRRWDGPGAVASALLLREKVKTATATVPDAVASAARYAYAGGRFEVIRFGHVENTVYEYDINSAYPTALRTVPDLTKGHWEHVTGDPGPEDFAIYHVKYEGYRRDLPGAYFRRAPNGTISYPCELTGWYWSPEVATGRMYCSGKGYGKQTVLEAWVFHSTCDKKPFDFVDGLYLKRKALKAGGDGAQVGIKLALNSLYGKTAQQVGWERKDNGVIRIPPFHQLEWAGFATSYCRGAILAACLENLESVIAFETDAVFTSSPLPVKIGDNLGDFECTQFSDLTYVQSGLYFGNTVKGLVTKTRGVDRGSMTRQHVLDKLGLRAGKDRTVVARLTRFVGAGIALMQSWDRWRRWETIEKRMVLEPTGKRIHKGCQHDDTTADTYPITFGEWHTTICPHFGHAHSAEFPIEWINPDPAMSELDELRNEVKDYE